MKDINWGDQAKETCRRMGYNYDGDNFWWGSDFGGIVCHEDHLYRHTQKRSMFLKIKKCALNRGWVFYWAHDSMGFQKFTNTVQSSTSHFSVRKKGRTPSQSIILAFNSIPLKLWELGGPCGELLAKGDGVSGIYNSKPDMNNPPPPDFSRPGN